MLTYVNHVLTLSAAHPRETLIALLLLGWVANWLAGSLDAVARGSFSFKEWPRILQSQLASSEALILWALYGTSILALVADAASKVYLAGHVSQADVDFVVNRILDLAAGASGLYAAKVWHEVLWLQLPDIFAALKTRLLSAQPAPKRNAAPA